MIIVEKILKYVPLDLQIPVIIGVYSLFDYLEDSKWKNTLQYSSMLSMYCMLYELLSFISFPRTSGKIRSLFSSSWSFV